METQALQISSSSNTAKKNKMEASRTGLLSLKSIILVLDSMAPHQYSGFSRTRREAFGLTTRYDEDNLPLTQITRRRKLERYIFDDSRHSKHPPRGQGIQSSALGTLPVEVFYHVLDFMTPDEYSGLSCTCRGMLQAVHRKLDAPQSYRIAPAESCMSWTASFVELRRIELEWLIRENGTTSGCYSYDPSEDNADL